VRLNLGYEIEIIREIFRAETMQTVIYQDAELEVHAFWHRQPVKLLRQWCHVVASTDAVVQSCCHVEDRLQWLS